MQNFPDWDQTHAPWGGSMETQPLDHQESPQTSQIVAQIGPKKHGLEKDVREESKVHPCKYYFYFQRTCW